jgi:hypothetical protein
MAEVNIGKVHGGERGHYVRVGGWSVAGPWGATGTLQGATLIVQDKLIVGLSAFEDAVYLRMQ